MPLCEKHYLVVKDGSPAEHNDDASAAHPASGRFAVSDGATESGFSRIWSRILVDQFVHHTAGSPDEWSWLTPAQQRWLEELKGVEIPWYGEEQFQLGAFATFLGLVISGTNGNRSWHAAAVGDSCLFHVRNGELLKAFPLDKAADFNSTPKLIGSRSRIDDTVSKRATSLIGTAENDDHLWLMSDALAHWCLAEHEAGQPPWQELSFFLSADYPASDFAAWVQDLRTNRGLHNDDVTLLGINV